MMGKLNGCLFWLKMMAYKKNMIDNIWGKVSADIKNNLRASLSAIVVFWKPKLNLIVMKLHVFIRKKFLEILQVFLKECKYMNKKVIRHIAQNIEIFPRDSDEE